MREFERDERECWRRDRVSVSESDGGAMEFLFRQGFAFSESILRVKRSSEREKRLFP
jgi:hypothetical protein